jgi:hypothetical protein
MSTIKITIEDDGTIGDAQSRLEHILERSHDRQGVLGRLGHYLRDVVVEVAPKSHRLTPAGPNVIHGAYLTLDKVLGEEVRFYMPYYFRWVIDGRGPVTARPGGMLHFWTERGEFYRRRVGPARANDFRKRAVKEATPGLQAIFGNWVDEIAKE